jgi:diguanylate cyclase (GGDEF)-like protein/PAS domain S-box-containing protein
MPATVIRKSGFEMRAGRNNISSILTKNFLKNFLKVFLPITLVLFIIALIYYITQTSAYRIVLDKEQTNTVEVQSKLISGEFDSIIRDLLILAEHNELQAYLTSPQVEMKQAVADEYLLFASRKGIYDQVRYLDDTGMEVIRVNYMGGTPVRVPEEELQFKGERYYFPDTYQLEKGKVFISPFDLNIEQGQVEYPLKTVIRFGTPVFDDQDRKRGIVLLNYLGEVLLQKMEQAAEGSAGEVLLLDGEGYWLNSPDPKAEWGDMYNVKNNLTPKTIYPEAWQQIHNTDEGQFETRDGLYTFTTIYPVSEDQVSSSGIVQTYDYDGGLISSGDYYWKIVSFVPHLVLTVGIQRSVQTIVLILIPLILGAVGVSVIIAKAWVVQEEASDAIQLTAKVFESTTEGIFITDRDGNIVNANQAFTTITGYPVNDVVGKNPRIFKSDRQDRAFYESFWKELKEDGRWQGEMWNRRKNGEVYPCWLRISAMEDEQGKLVHYVAVFNDITERKQTEERLEFLATHDPLTNLPNRVLFNDQFKHALNLASRSEQKVALMYLDLDGFKDVNDTYGHETGDKLLKDISVRLKEELRESDTVARLGGDEFAFIIENVKDQEDVTNVAEKVLEVLKEVILVDQLDIYITGSLGICVYPDNGDEAEILLKKADTAMYRAKEAGKNLYYLCEQ